MKTLLIILVSLSSALLSYSQTSKFDALERLVHQVEINQSPTATENTRRRDPVVTFEWMINKATTLKSLAALQERALRKLSVVLSYRQIAFDSTGLSAITIEAHPKTGKTVIVSQNVADCDDFGVFQIQSNGQECLFVGRRSNWTGCIPMDIAVR